MVLRLPAQIENAVGILSDVTGGVALGADGGQEIVGRAERGESFRVCAGVERAKPVENLFGGEAMEPCFRGTGVVQGKAQASFVPIRARERKKSIQSSAK